MTPFIARFGRGRLLACLALLSALSFLLLASPAALAFEVCAPPACSVPVAYDAPGLYGETGLEKLLMACSTIAAWMLVNGFLLALGLRASRPMPAMIRGDKQKREAWLDMERQSKAQWAELKKSPGALAGARRLGRRMAMAGALMSAALVCVDGAGSPALAHSRAQLIDWSSGAPAPVATLELLPKGQAIEIQADGSAKPWGQWSANGDRLRLSQAGSPSPSFLIREQTQLRYWAASPPAANGRSSVSMSVEITPPPERPRMERSDA